MKNKRKIAYIRIADYPIPNKILASVLSETFPEFEVKVFELSEMIKQDKVNLILNAIVMLRYDLVNLIAGRKSFWGGFYSTPFFFHWVKQTLSRLINPDEYVFSIQIQSIFDGAIDSLPHFVYTDHTHLANLHYAFFDHRKLRSSKWIALETSVYHNATMNFVRSSNIKESLIEQYNCPADKIAIIGVGSNVKIQQLTPDNGNYTNKNILFVGIDWERKGGPILLQAFEKVLQHHPDAQLTIVGCQPEVALPNVNIIGKIPADALPPYYQKASIFSLPTKLEPFGVVFIEAMHYQLPIVATRIGAVPDMVIPDKNGFLIEPDDADALAGHLIDLMDHPDKCASFGQASYDMANERYTWERVGEAIRQHTKPFMP